MNDPDDIYGSTFEHGGSSVKIDPEVLVYADDAIERLPAIAARFAKGRACTVLMDARTRDVAGSGVACGMLQAGWQVQTIVVPDRDGDRPPVCDDVTRDALRPQLQSPDMIVAVGSGVINDLAKWLAHDAGIPYISFGTAASMNGYASANVAPTVKGVKRLERGSAPKAILTTPAIIAAAPQRMTASGLGDVLAKSVSATDWKLNHVLFGDDYVDEAVSLIAGIEPLYLDHPEDVRDAKPEAMKALFDALCLTGVAMTMAGTSSPASGGEHLVSHALDMLASVDGADHDLHGRQVGLGTILASELYARVFAIDAPAFDPRTAVATDFTFWGGLADHVSEAYAPKVERIETACAKLAVPGAWDDLKRQLQPMLRPPEKTRECLAAAGAAHTPSGIGCAPERLASVLEHCHEIRSRFTILDLARMTGAMPGAARELVDGLG